MPLSIVRDDLVNRREDAIVLPSNDQLVIDGGAGLAVANVAGTWRLRRACRKIGGCEVGDAVATPAFKFPARFLVHAVGPIWTGTDRDAELLGRAYRSALERASDLGCESVAVPLLSAGTFGCPSHISLSIALSVIEQFLAQSDLRVVLVLFDKKAIAASLDFLVEVESHIDDAYVDHYHSASFSYGAQAMPPLPSGAPRTQSFGYDARVSAPPSSGRMRRERRSIDRAMEADEARLETTGEIPPVVSESRGTFGAASDAAPMPLMQARPMGLEDRLDAMDDSFSRALLQLIDERGLTDAEVYHRANMTRQHFSKIRNNVGYRPSKSTVWALCVALELDLESTRDLLERAGFAISHASKFDIIVEYFIERGDYDPFRINETLFYFDQPLLG